MKVTVAIIGCGRIAQNAHLPALTKMEDVRIKYACDIIPEKAEAVVKKYDNVEIAITDYKVALADPEVDAVFVLTPNYAHYTVTMDALRAGKHVMCEKPITVNYALSVEMAKEAKKQGIERFDKTESHSNTTKHKASKQRQLPPRHTTKITHSPHHVRLYSLGR